MQTIRSFSSIVLHCIKFREAIQAIPAHKRPIEFIKFPCGSCGSTSEMIGTYLESLGFGKFYYMHGSKPGIESHAWIKQGNLVIDLTADQFICASQSVIVSECSTWHNEFEIATSHAVDLAASDSTAFFPLTPFYEMIVRKVQEMSDDKQSKTSPSFAHPQN